jgi:hypothetical protein
MPLRGRIFGPSLRRGLVAVPPDEAVVAPVDGAGSAGIDLSWKDTRDLEGHGGRRQPATPPAQTPWAAVTPGGLRTAGHSWLYRRLVPTSPKQAPPPLEVDTLRVVLVGTALWAVALVVLLLLGDRVDPLWKWTCVAGIALAAVGVGIMRWQGQLRRRRVGRELSR